MHSSLNRALLAITLTTGVLLAGTAAGGEKLNDYGPPERGYGLTEKQAADGWLSLFDGKTTFGWAGAAVKDGALHGGRTLTAFGDCKILVEVAAPGTLVCGDLSLKLTAGKLAAGRLNATAAPLRLEDGAAVRTILLKPQGLEPLFNGRDLEGWKRIDRAKVAKEKQPRWEVKDGLIHAVGGPGALEYEGSRFGDLVLQVEVRSRAKHTNGGLFFRCMPGSFMNGYEAQVHNRCEGGDPAKPSRYATGGIDDRQNARRLVSRDGVPFVMTVVATGPHLATWINGYQVADWTDTRAKHANPRQGLRTEPGTVQLQAHDPETDLEFRAVRAAALRGVAREGS
jgi:hypothetical protein